MSVTRSLRGLVSVIAASIMLAACAPTRRAPSVSVNEPSGYARYVVAGGYQFGGGIAVLSSPEGDVLFVPNGSGIDELDGDTGRLRRRHRSPFDGVDNVARQGRHIILLSASNGRVGLWDPATDDVIDTFGSYAGPINAAGFAGALLVVELERGGISRRGNDGHEAETLVAGMRAPAGLTGTAADLWVDDRASGTILQVVANGELLAEPIEVATGLAEPEGLAVTLGGSLIVAETGAGRLLRVDLKTSTVHVIDDRVALDAASGSGRNPIGTFAGVAIGACGTIYVTADATGEIIRYVPEGPVVCRYGE